MATAPLYLTEADVQRLVSLNDAIAALEAMLLRQERGEAQAIPKSLATFGDRGSLHALGSLSEGAGYGAFKTWVNTPNGAQAVLSLFDLNEGRFVGLMDAGLLGQLRTSGISGLATDWLADPAADELAIAGTGRQAALQIASVAAVRPLRRLRVYSPTEENRRAFAETMRTLFPFEVTDHATPEAAFDGAPIVTLVTRARAPFVTSGMIDKDAHVNAVGAILPANSEFTGDVFEAASRVVVDSLDGVRQNSREFIDHYGAEDAAWASIETLGSVIAKGDRTRPAGMTLFKAMGMGLSDLAIAELVADRAAKEGLGQVLTPARPEGMPRWELCTPEGVTA